ncbi:MAG TPA: hypothetical protein VF532_09285, partial [Candidatus Angelobacter sp.]
MAASWGQALQVRSVPRGAFSGGKCVATVSVSTGIKMMVARELPEMPKLSKNPNWMTVLPRGQFGFFGNLGNSGNCLRDNSHQL